MVTLNGAFNPQATAKASFSGHKVQNSGFPFHKLGLKVELLVNTTWTDITQYVMLRDPISISPIGRTDETAQMEAGTMTLTLKNTDGRFTPNNASGAYYPYVQLNTQLRLSVNDQSTTGVTYTGYRFWGEVSEWPPLWDVSQRDVAISVTVSGIWRRISQATATATLGSPFTRWNTQLVANNPVAGYWPMEDGTGATTFAAVEGTSANAMTIVTNAPTLASCTAFPGSDAIPQLNGAELSGTINSSISPTQIVFRFLLFVQSGGDTGVPAGPLARLHLGTNTTLSSVDVSLGAAGGGPFTITGVNSTGGTVFTSTLTDVIWGKPIMVQVGLVKSGSNVIWSLNTILPGTTTWYGTTTGTATGVSLADASSVIFSPGSQWKNVAVGQAIVFYSNPSITQDASALSGWGGENALTRFRRICTEEGINVESIGVTSTTMGPQIDDTLINVLQTVEDTDGGFIYETQDQFGLGYRTMQSLQNQSSTLTLNYAAAQLDPSLAPVNDDSLTRNDVTLANYNGYSVRIFLENGARSLNNPPNGVGAGYEYSRNTNSTSNAQVNALASQILDCGCTFQNRYPTITVNLARTTTASLFGSVPSVRQGDYLQVTNMPAFMGGGTEKQLIWGWTETLSAFTWEIAYNTIPEAPWESSFNPGTSQSGQVPGSPVTASQSGTVSGAQIAEGAIIGLNLAQGTVQGANIANATITATNIATATITGVLIGTGQITGTNIASGTIEGTNIDTATIAGSNIAAGTIQGTNIQNATITTTQISGSANITGAQIASATIAAANITAGTITATQIANATITGAKVVSGTITATQIASATITTSQISSTAGITGSQIASNTIQAANIQSATITNVQIAAGTITGSNIGANQITNSQIANATITNIQISNNTITTSQISNTAGITGTQVASNTITATNIAALTIGAAQIAAGAITAGKISAGAIDGMTITGANIIADGSAGQFLIYSGSPEPGNMIGSWSGVGGTDGFGNIFPAGLSVQQGVITGLDIDSIEVTNSDWEGGVINNAAINNPQLTGGTITETNIVFDQTDGNLLIYASTTTTVTLTTGGTGTWTVPAGVTQASIAAIAAGQGGDGGKTSGGGNGGIGGSYAGEPIYNIPLGTGTIPYTIGIAGTGGVTGPASHGANGGDTLFGGVNGVHAIGGNNSGYGPFNTVNHAGGAGGATPSSTGGSSGGNSGGPTVSGNAGIKATTSTGAAAPTTQAGTGHGAPGGNSGSNANTAASSPGGGGGGAGEGTANNVTNTYSPTWVGSYFGPDASSGANTLRSSSTLYQGISSRGGGATSGNQRAMMRFNASQIHTDFSGTTGYQAFLNITNLSTSYGTGMMVEVSYASTLVGASQLSNYTSYAGGVTHAVDWFVPAGTTVAIPLGQTACAAFGGDTIDTIIIGADVAANYAGVQDWQGYFSAASVSLTVQATPSTSAKSGSAGGTGQIAITYTSGQTLIGAIAPVAGVDSLTNAFGAGFTGQVAAIEPASNPTAVETWHSVLTAGLLNSWTVGTGGNFRYKLMPDNTVMIHMNNISGGATANPTALWNIPAGYRPASSFSQNFPIDVGTASTASAITPSVYVTSGNQLMLQNAQSSLTNFSVTIRYALD